MPISQLCHVSATKSSLTGSEPHLRDIPILIPSVQGHRFDPTLPRMMNIDDSCSMVLTSGQDLLSLDSADRVGTLVNGNEVPVCDCSLAGMSLILWLLDKLLASPWCLVWHLN